MDRVTTRPESRHQLLNGWLCSLILHGLFLCVAITWVRQSPITMPTNPFQWDVTLVQSTQRQDKPMVPTPEPAQAVVKANAPRPTVTTSPERTAAADAHKASVQPTMNDTASAQSQLEAPSSTVQAAPPSESTFTEPVPNVPQTTDVARQHPDLQPTTTTQESPVPVDTRSPTTNELESAPVQPTQSQAMASAQMDTVSPSRADYSWLQQMIFRRLEELKRFSQPQLDDFRPLKVLVRAVVSSEGTLLQSEVVKSSGLDRIDQEAMALVQRAFPMQLDRTIDRRQIVMRIPISYSRD